MGPRVSGLRLHGYLALAPPPGKASEVFLFKTQTARVSSVRALHVVTILLGAFAGCESPPAAADLKEWTPQDHDHSDDKQNVASGAQVAPAASGSKDDGTRTLVEATWRN